MGTEEQPEPSVFIIFGGVGDLTWRKRVPALFDLSQDRRVQLPGQPMTLPPRFRPLPRKVGHGMVG